ncbi:MAG: hypothetical protein A3J24_05175 [Deltaproteobacteria bacterium RIFCSPLOWO2_02_FULL_53_8]|nr:MAG: hypothetical protein A3J24_05175 [Deltaproteobacteria bacterium RIFCSPLOWO2_02_FULL_53_8]
MRKITLPAMIIAVGLFVAAMTGCSKPGDDQPKQVNTAEQGVVVQPPQSASVVVSDLKARVAQNPNDADAVVGLANTYFELKQFNEAITYYKQALVLKPGDADIYNELGLCYHYTNNAREAVRYLEEGIQKNPYHQRIWLTKGFVLAYGMGDLEAARASWEKAVALNPESQIGKAAGEYLAMFKQKRP